jgi:intracellular sulfur oxidation DsrE/DsrF family protein
MKKDNTQLTEQRRKFLKGIGTGTAAIGLAAVTSSFTLTGSEKSKYLAKDPADEWFDDIDGEHRIVYDATRPHMIFQFAWPRVFLITNAATGTAEEDCSVVLVLRHEAICYAFQDHIWAKYNFGDVFNAHAMGPAFKAADASTATKTRNPFWNVKEGDFALPAFGVVPIGIKDLQASGVKICVCNAAVNLYAAVLAGQMGLTHEEVLADWMDGAIPGIQQVPSGVWALGRAQKHGCGYIFAG